METSKARIVFAIDVASQTRDLSSLRSIFSAHRQPATWTFADLSSPAVADVAANQLEHEISLLAASAWSRPAATRRAFHQGLIEQLQQAAMAGVSVSSIASTHADVPEQLDLLGKLGICAVRTSPAARRRWPLSTAAAKPTALRYGIWQMPITVDVARDGLRVARVAMQKAIGQQETVVLRIDTEQVATRTVECLLQLAAKSQVLASTLTAAVDSRARRRPMSPAQSILRAA